MSCTSKSKLLERLRETKILTTSGRHHLPLPTGPLKTVGCRDFMVGYSRKSGVFVRLFYPAAKKTENDLHNPLLWPNWLPHEYYRIGYDDVIGNRSKMIRRLLLRLSETKNVFIPAIPNVKPLSGGVKRFPVVVFSHGLGACRTTYSTICVELASHGFVVAGMYNNNSIMMNSLFFAFIFKRLNIEITLPV